MTAQISLLEVSYLVRLCMSESMCRCVFACVKDIALLPRCRPCDDHFVWVPQSSPCLLLLMMVYDCNFCSQTVHRQSPTELNGCVYFHRMSE